MNIIELNGGFSSKPCLITKGYIWENYEDITLQGLDLTWNPIKKSAFIEHHLPKSYFGFHRNKCRSSGSTWFNP